jgi:MFS family permease
MPSLPVVADSRLSFRREILQAAVIVGALGYFVDVYDLILFSIVRIPSLKDLGFSGDGLVSNGILLLNLQMAGMLAGGIVFGILGDRLGRVILLFGSILLYSVANFANGLVHSIEAYAVWRFIAGVGLAGELGGSITLVSEMLSKENRGYGTAMVATIGVMGAVAGGLVAGLVPWRTAYFIGGGLGLLLLAARVSVAESGMFHRMRKGPAAAGRGNFLALFSRTRRFGKYIRCILIGLPTWFVVGVLVTFSPEISHALRLQGSVKVSYAVMSVYLGITAGDFASGFLSQWLRSRKKAVLIFLLLTVVGIAGYFAAPGWNLPAFYAAIGFLGMGVGYWAVFVTIAAEQFGTNLRATAATTVPNFVRGAVVPMTLAFNFCKLKIGIVSGAAAVGLACILIAFWALHGLDETYGKDLDFIDPI